MHHSVKRLRGVDPESNNGDAHSVMNLRKHLMVMVPPMPELMVMVVVMVVMVMTLRKHLMVMVPPTQEAFTDGWKSSPSPFSATTLKRLWGLIVTQRMVQR